MKKSIVFFFFLMISVSAIWAQQRTGVRLTGLKKESVIIYTTNEVVLKFDKQSFLDEYALMEKGVWVERNEREYKAATTAIEWLKKQSKAVQLNETMTDQSKPETSLAWLVQNLIGAPLIMKGNAEIFDLKGKQKKEDIEVLVEASQLSVKSYSLFNPAQLRSFLKIWNVNEWEAYAQDVQGDVELVFEEPVEERNVPDQNKVYTVVEQQPEYPGGFDKWVEYLKKSLKYPKDAVKQQIEGSVFVAYVVLETGKLTDINVIKGISPSCDKEAVRLITESIDWKPGKQNGKAVKVKFVMPVKFRLSDLEEKKK